MVGCPVGILGAGVTISSEGVAAIAGAAAAGAPAPAPNPEGRELG